MTLPVIEVVDADGQLVEKALVYVTHHLYALRDSPKKRLHFRRNETTKYARGTQVINDELGDMYLTEETISDIEELVGYDVWDSGWSGEGRERCMGLEDPYHGGRGAKNTR